MASVLEAALKNEPNFVSDSDVQVNAIVDLITTLEPEQHQAIFAKLAELGIVTKA
jgi:hypothetical protein